MTWDLPRIINKHNQIVKELNKNKNKHTKVSDLDYLKSVKLNKLKNYEAIYDNVSDFLNKTDFDFIPSFNLYKYNAKMIVNYELDILKESLAIELIYENIKPQEIVSFIEQYPGIYLLTNANDEKQKILINLKSEIKPFTCVKNNHRIFDKAKKDNDLICAIHRLNTLRKTKIKIEGRIPNIDKRALNRIKNNIKKISDKNFVAIGFFKKIGKKHVMEIYDLIYYDKRDLSKEPIKKRKLILDSLFKNNELTHIVRK